MRESGNVLAVFWSLSSSTLYAVVGILFRLGALSPLQNCFLFGLAGTLIGLTCFLLSENSKPFSIVFSQSYRKAAFLALTLSTPVYLVYLEALDHWNVGEVLAVNSLANFSAAIIVEIFKLRRRPHFLTLLAAAFGYSGLILICVTDSRITNKSQSNPSISVKIAIMSMLIVSSLAAGFRFGLLQKLKKVSNFWHSSLACAPYVLVAPYFVISNKTQLHVDSCNSYRRLWAVLGAAGFYCAAVMGVKSSQMSLPSISFILKLSGIVVGYTLNFIFVTAHLNLVSILGSILIAVAIFIQSFVLIQLHPTPALINNMTDKV